MPKLIPILLAALYLVGCTAAPGPGFGSSSIPNVNSAAPPTKDTTNTVNESSEEPIADYQQAAYVDLDGSGARDPILILTGSNRGSVRVAKTNAVKARLDFRASRATALNLTGSDSVRDLVILNDDPGDSNEFGLRVFDGKKLYDEGILEENVALRYSPAVYGIHVLGSNLLLALGNALVEVDVSLNEVSRKDIRAFKISDATNEGETLVYVETDEQNCESSRQRNNCLAAYSPSNFSLQFKMGFTASPTEILTSYFQDKNFDGTRDRLFVSDSSKTYRVFNDGDRDEMITSSNGSIPSTRVAAFPFYQNEARDLVVVHEDEMKLYAEGGGGRYTVTLTRSTPGILGAFPLRIFSNTGDLVMLYPNRVEILEGAKSGGAMSFTSKFLIED